MLTEAHTCAVELMIELVILMFSRVFDAVKKKFAINKTMHWLQCKVRDKRFQFKQKSPFLICILRNESLYMIKNSKTIFSVTTCWLPDHGLIYKYILEKKKHKIVK